MPYPFFNMSCVKSVLHSIWVLAFERKLEIEGIPPILMLTLVSRNLFPLFYHYALLSNYSHDLSLSISLRHANPALGLYALSESTAYKC